MTPWIRICKLHIDRLKLSLSWSLFLPGTHPPNHPWTNSPKHGKAKLSSSSAAEHLPMLQNNFTMTIAFRTTIAGKAKGKGLDEGFRKQQLLTMQQWKRKQTQKCCPVPSGLEAEKGKNTILIWTLLSGEGQKYDLDLNSSIWRRAKLQNDHCLQNDCCWQGQRQRPWWRL